MGNSLLDITVFGRRAAQSVKEHLPERKPVTLSSLLKYRQQLKSIGEAKGTSPQLFPKASQMKFQLATAPPAQETGAAENTKASERFEPPDPFGGRFAE